MAKRYINAEDILRAVERDELNEEGKKYRSLMQEAPNFNHEKYTCDKRVYENDKFVILKVRSKGKTGYIVHNTRKPFENGHTHLNSFSMAKVIVNNVIHKKNPKTNNIYLLESHIRLSEDEKYISYIKHLIDVKKCKKDEYFNRTSDKRR